MSSYEKGLLKGTPTAAAQILRDFMTGKKAIAERPRVRHGASNEQMQTARQAAATETAALKAEKLKQLEELAQTTEQRANSVVAALNNSLRKEPADTNAALLQEMRSQRAWERLRPVMERAAEEAVNPGDHASIRAMDRLSAVEMTAQEALTAALASGDEDTIGMIRTEIPAYVHANFGAQQRDNAVARLNATLSAARPEFAAVIADLQEVEAGRDQVRRALFVASRALEEDKPLAHIPGWPGEETQEVWLAEEGDKMQVSSWGGSQRSIHIPSEQEQEQARIAGLRAVAGM